VEDWSDDPQIQENGGFLTAIVPANGYLLVWADEDGNATDGCTPISNFAAEDQVLLLDSDANNNALLDSVTLAPGTRSFLRALAE
jgi:hypothetical protein